MTFLLCDPDWYVQKPDVQNKWDDNTHTYTLSLYCTCPLATVSSSFFGLATNTLNMRNNNNNTLTDRCSFLCVSGQRGTIAKSMHEEHLFVVALTSMERGTQFFPLASYFLV